MRKLSFGFMLPILLLVASVLGCSGNDETTRRVQYGPGLLDMMISDRWELEEETDETRVYVLKELEDVELHLSSSTEDFGQPLRVVDVKSLVGKELNRQYGGVSTLVSLGGNAMIKYTRSVLDDEEEDVRLEEWVLAKPAGFGEIVRVGISLYIPARVEGNPSIPELIERLDRQVGDARIPRA